VTRTLDLPADADARRAISDALDETLVVEAAAGTGKTTELVTRIVAVLARGRATMDGIVAVTFTEKAAGELKLRLRESLEVERSGSIDPSIRARLEKALHALEEAHVGTIHGFCAELLRERPVEAGVDPLFTVLTEAQAERLYARAFRNWLQVALEDPPQGVRRALRRSSGPAFGGLEDSGPIERLRGAGWTLATIRDFTHPWLRRPFDRDAEVARLVESLHQLAELSRAGSDRDRLFQSLERVRRESQQIRLEQSLGQRDIDAWESRLIDLTRDPGLARTKKGYGAKYGALSRADVLAARDAFYAALLEFRAAADGHLAALLQEELKAPTAAYQELKRRKGALDFADLLTCTRDLLRSDPGVRRHLQQRFVRIFVDEFQDTDPVQAEILLLLAAEDSRVEQWLEARPQPGKLFIVGDPKQAIYRFRGADVGTYWRVRDRLEACGGRVLQLMTNFRSVPAIQRFVNRAFETEMIANQRALQAEYVPLAERRPADETQPALVALPVPAPYSSGRVSGNAITGRAVDASLPDAIGAFVEWLVQSSGWEVPERGPDRLESRVAVQPRHVALLFRRFTSYRDDATRPYIEALEARGIPHLLVGGKSFHDREEVETMRAALAAIEWPDDELSVFATLKGSLFAVDDELLLEYRHRFGAFHPFRIARELGGNSGADFVLAGEPLGHLLPIAGSLRELQQLHRGRNERPIADTVARLLQATRAHVGFVLRPGGEQALANVLHVSELARQYETEGGLSFRGFIDQLRQAAEATAVAEAPIVEEGSDGVRLMTVHKAKGLEFPVVVLADLTCRLNRDEASRYLDVEKRLCAVKIGGWAPHDLHEHEVEEVRREQAEGVRLAYVAATRARDLLVVPVIGDAAWEGGWLSPLNRAVYPPIGSRRAAARGARCPAAKSADSVLFRPDDCMPDERTVAPGLHDFGDYAVLWCDPRWFALGVEPAFGVRRQELIVKEAQRGIVEARRHAYDSWRAARNSARQHGGAASLAVRTVGSWARDAPAEPLIVAPEDVAVVSVDPAATEPHAGGARFGMLLHAVLAQAPFDADGDGLRALAGTEGRALGATEEEVANAARSAARVLAHGLLDRARRAEARGVCRREIPVTLTLADGTLLEGVVDLAFEEHGSWTIVDYKTDRELLAAGEARYRRQVACYASAVAQATGGPATGVLIRI
jgi:ATP-dependent exoDNAse (exonuclease V) beta subunit